MAANNTAGTRTALSVIKVMLGILLTVIFYMLVIFVVSGLCKQTYKFVYQIFGEVTVQEAPGNDVTFVIEEGDSLMNISKRLEYSNLVVNKYSFFIRAKLSTSSKKGGSVFPGTYDLNTSMTYGEILAVITDYGGDESQGNKK